MKEIVTIESYHTRTTEYEYYEIVSQITVIYTYVGNSDLVSTITDSTGTTTFTYDANARLVSYTGPGNSIQTKVDYANFCRHLY